MYRSALPYSVRWTSNLLRRDVKSFTTKLTTKLKSKFNREGANVSATPYDKIEVSGAEAEREECPRVLEPCSISVDTVVGSELPHDGRDINSADSATAVPFKLIEDPKYESPANFKTLYELLESKLKVSYAARDRDLSLEDRWYYRGSWLLLHMAVQACPSNDSYNILRDGKAAPDESAMLLEILQLNGPAHPATKINQIPAAPYMKPSSDHLRLDSGYGSIDFNRSAHDQLALNTKQATPPPAQIWRAILEATSDQSKITTVAETLLGYVWPEKDAADVLSRIGHPQKQLDEQQLDEICQKFQDLLFLEYKTLVESY